MSSLYRSADEEAQHLQAIRSIAAETGRELEAVKQVYEQQLADLSHGAHVRSYLPLLASRRTLVVLGADAAAARSGSHAH